MSNMSDSSYYTNTGSAGQAQRVQFSDYSQPSQDPQNMVENMPEPPTKHVHFEDEQHSHSHDGGGGGGRGGPQNFGPPQEQFVPAADPHATMLTQNDFKPQQRERLVNNGYKDASASPADDSSMWSVGTIVAIVVVVGLVGVVIYLAVRNKSQAVSEPLKLGGMSAQRATSMGTPTLNEDIFGSGALSDLEYL